MLTRSSYRHSRPAPRKASGPPKPITDDVTWTRIVDPHEQYRIAYLDKNDQHSKRTIDLTKIGHSGEFHYLGVMQDGKFKTLRADRVVDVLEQLSTGHAPSIFAAPQYSTVLPVFPIDKAVYKVPATAAYSTRTWTVDLNLYTCTCPEKRIRSARGYKPGQLGFCCDHIAKAILANLPANAPGWSDGLRAFLGDSRKLHIDNLVSNSS